MLSKTTFNSKILNSSNYLLFVLCILVFSKILSRFKIQYFNFSYLCKSYHARFKYKKNKQNKVNLSMEICRTNSSYICSTIILRN